MDGDLRGLGGHRSCWDCQYWTPTNGWDGHCFGLPPNPVPHETVCFQWCSLFVKDTAETRSVKDQLMAEYSAQLDRDLADSTRKANLRYAALGVAQSIRQGIFHERIERHKAEAKGIREPT